MPILPPGNLHRLYFYANQKINENLAEVLQYIEADVKNLKSCDFDVEAHNEGLRIIYNHFKEELLKRQNEKEASQITSEQKHFLDRLQASYNLFNANPHYQKKVDELYQVYSREIPDYAKSQLSKLRRENLSDDMLLDALQKLIDASRILNFQEKEKETESMIIRTICSEGFN